MKAKAVKSGSINYLGRTVSVDEGMEYDIEDVGLTNILLTDGLIVIVKPGREYKKGMALKSDRAQISMEDHEQSYMRDKIKDFTKDELLVLYSKTQMLLGNEDVMDLSKDTKKEIIKIIAKEFAEINDRKKVNKIISEVRKDGFKDLSQ